MKHLASHHSSPPTYDRSRSTRSKGGRKKWSLRHNSSTEEYALVEALYNIVQQVQEWKGGWVKEGLVGLWISCKGVRFWVSCSVCGEIVGVM